MINETGLPLAVIPARASFTERSVSFVVKGTFDLVPGAAATVAAQQRPISADVTYMDELGRSLCWSDDLVPYKPHTDFLILGAFHAPNGAAVTQGRASFVFGPLHKEIVLHGPRIARVQRDDTWVVSPAEPVRSVPLRWELSFGGLKDPRNPFGMGTEVEVAPDGSKFIRLPQIEDPRSPLRGPRDRPAPANFAPVPAIFQERRRKLGTHDQRWALFRAPLPPKDYDASHINAAPAGQQAGNSPHGDETLVLHNLHPATPEFNGSLPGLKLRVAVLRATGTELVPEEIPMRIDTVVTCPDDNQLVILWRGVAPLQETDHDVELPWLECDLQPIGAPPPDPDLPQRLLARSEALARAEQAKKDVLDAHTQAQIEKLISQAKLPPALIDLLKTEKDEKVLFAALEKHVDSILAPILSRLLVDQK